MVILCSNCKKEIRPGRNFCGFCGTPVKKKERRCNRCNELLEDGENFCPMCGEKYIEARHEDDTYINQSSTIKTESCCINTIKGKVAIIDDNLYFVGDYDGYYNFYSDYFIGCVSLNNNSKKARVIINKSNFIRTVKSGNARLLIDRLHAWNGKLYFSAVVFAFKGDETIFGNGYLHGIFSFCPKTNKLEMVKSVSVNFYEYIRVFFYNNYAFYLNCMDIETGKRLIEALKTKYGNQNDLYYWKENHYILAQLLVTFDLETYQESRLFMPMVAERDWIGHENGSGEIVKNWNNLIYHKGFIYTSVKGAEYCSLRFPVHNPEAYEFLPYNTIVLNDYVTGLNLFAACGDTIILQNSDDKLIAISQSTLRPIDSFDQNYFDRHGKKWQIYNENYLVCIHSDNDYANVFDIRNANYCDKTVGVEYCNAIYDNICYNNYIYFWEK